MIITISGKPGSGKTTVGKMLARRLRCPFYSIGYIRRQMARKRGMTLEQFNRYGETHPSTDRDIDRWQADRAKKLRTAVFEGRTAFHFIPQSFKIFLDVDLRVAVKRLVSDRSAIRRFEADRSNLPAIVKALRVRLASDVQRYWKFYHLKYDDRRHFDLYISTTKQSQKDTLKVILQEMAKISKKEQVVEKNAFEYSLSTKRKTLKS